MVKWQYKVRKRGLWALHDGGVLSSLGVTEDGRRLGMAAAPREAISNPGAHGPNQIVNPKIDQQVLCMTT